MNKKILIFILICSAVLWPIQGFAIPDGTGNEILIGNVGINSMAPGKQLDVQGTVRAVAYLGDGSALTNLPVAESGGGFTDDGTIVHLTTSTDNLGIGTVDASNGKLIVTGGNVGIGTTLPDQLVTLTGATPALKIINSNDPTNYNFTIRQDWNYGQGLKFYQKNQLIISSTQDGTNLQLQPTSGNVGIGTSMVSATAKLAVIGGNVGIGTTVPAELLTLNHATRSLLRFERAGTAVGWMGEGDALFAGDATSDFAITTNTGKLNLGTAGTRTLTLTSGNVGIGTTVPSGLLEVGAQKFNILSGGNVGVGSITPGQKLDVQGTVRATYFSGDGSALTNLPAAASGGGFTDDGTIVHLTTSTDNLGIGTVDASNGKLIVTGGNVGIGTTTPTATLNVYSTPQSGPSLVKDNPAAFRINGTYGLALEIGTGFNSPFPVWLQTHSSQTDGQSFPLALNPLGGNVGIGTTVPSGLLEVGAQKFNVLTEGNVGVGSITPGQKLDVQGTVRATAFLGDGSGLTGLSSAGGFTDDGTVVRLTTDSDNVGIGTMTSTEKLQVNGNLTLYGGLFTAEDFLFTIQDANVSHGLTGMIYPIVGRTHTLIRNNHTTKGGSLVMGVTDEDASVGLHLYGILGVTDPTDTTPAVVVNAAKKNTTDVQSLGSSETIFQVQNNTSALMTVLGSGNVGIGSLFPAEVLDVAGTVRATYFSGDGSALTNLPAAASGGGFTDDGTIVHLTTSTDNLGIGTVDASQGKLIVIGGNVGIGSTVPNHALLELTGDGAKEILRINDVGPNDTTPFVVKSSGNVGIGTTAPGFKLAVNGTTYSAGDIFIGGSKKLYLWGDTTGGYITNSGNGNTGLSFVSRTVTDPFVFVNGNVGIGTALPAYPLDIPAGGLSIGANGGVERIKTITSSIASPWDILTIASRGHSSGWFGTINLDLSYNNGSTFTALTARSNSNGTSANVGIGTTLPLSLLEVGVRKFNVLSGGNVGIGTVNPGEKLEVNAGYIYTNAGLGAINNGVQTASGIKLGSDSTPKAPIIANWRGATSDNQGIDIRTYSTGYIDALRILGNGNLGIGTTVPSGLLEVGAQKFNVLTGGNVGVGSITPGQKLDVQGTVRASYFSGDGSGLTNVTAASGGGFTDDGTVVHLTTSTDNVGIGTVDASNGKLIVVGGNVGIGTTTPSGGLVVMNGNVGIGTWKPAAMLDIKGKIGVGAGPLSLVLLDQQIDISTRTLSEVVGITFSNYDGTQNSRAWEKLDATAKVFYQGHTYSSGGDLDYSLANGRIYAKTGGNVGIGTFAPLGLLEVGAQKFNVLTGGNVGVGSITPGQKLDVQGTVRATYFSGDGSALTNLPAAASGWTLGASNVGISTTNNVGIGTNLTTTAGLTVMNGNVGIGTWNPVQFLDINGNLRVGGKTIYGDTTNPHILLSDALGAYLYYGTAALVKVGASIDMHVNSQSALTISGADVSTTPGVYSKLNVGIGTITPVGGLVVMSGNVGIGTWVPQGALQVVGGQVLIADGLVGTPSIGFSSDNDGTGTGFYRTTTNRLGVSINGVLLGQFLSTGFEMSSGYSFSWNNLGSISSSSDGIYRWSANGGANIKRLILGQTDGTGPALGVSATTVGIINGDGSFGANLGIGTIYADGRLIVSGGNVGIGSIRPGQVLDVQGTVRASYFSGDGSALTNLPAASSGWTLGASNVGISTTNNVGIGTNLTTTAALTVMSGNVGIGTWVPAGQLQVNNPTSINSPFIIDNAGNVGIGTTQTTTAGLTIMNGNVGIGTWKPTQLLAVGANAFTVTSAGVVTGNTYNGATVSSTTISAAFTNGRASIGNSGTGSSGLQIKGGGGTSSYIQMVPSIGGASPTTDYLSFLVNGTLEAMRVQNNSGLANIGIGSWGTPRAFLDVAPPSNGAESPIINAFSVNSSGNVGIGTFNAYGGQLIISSGNVGIGSSAPGQALDVTGTVRATAFVGDGSALTNLPAASSGWTLGASNVGISTTNNVGIGTNLTTTAALTVMSGNLGIGTWKPVSRLELKSDLAANDPIFYLSNSNTVHGVTSEMPTNSFASFRMVSSTGTGGLEVEGISGANNIIGLNLHGIIGNASPTTSAILIQGEKKSGAGGGPLSSTETVLIIKNSSTALMTFKGSGNVGIGSTVPGEVLDVTGTVRATAFSGDGSALTNLPAAASGWTLGASNVGISTTNNVGIGTNLTTTAALTVMSGNVGIGTWKPRVALEVNGGIIGFPANSQSAAYTTVFSDAGKFIIHPASDDNPRTFTIDSNANVSYPVGTTITFINMINTVTIAITSDTMTLMGAGSTGSRTLAANGMATAVKISATAWIISGVNLT